MESSEGWVFECLPEVKVAPFDLTLSIQSIMWSFQSVSRCWMVLANARLTRSSALFFVWILKTVASLWCLSRIWGIRFKCQCSYCGPSKQTNVQVTSRNIRFQANQEPADINTGRHQHAFVLGRSRHVNASALWAGLQLLVMDIILLIFKITVYITMFAESLYIIEQLNRSSVQRFVFRPNTLIW